MFTGIVAAVGRIVSVQQQSIGLRLDIDCGGLGLDDVARGDSIAVNGVCLTVIGKHDAQFSTDVSNETLRCTEGLSAVDAPVNLEKAMRLADRVGGHLVTGHVDGVGEVVLFERIGDHVLLRVRAPEALQYLIARKGSIAVNGVSLTVNQVGGAEFYVNLIPHTLAMTNLQDLAVGRRVNLEVDMIARYVERALESAR